MSDIYHHNGTERGTVCVCEREGVMAYGRVVHRKTRTNGRYVEQARAVPYDSVRQLVPPVDIMGWEN